MDLKICARPSCRLYSIPGKKYCRRCSSLIGDCERKKKSSQSEFKSQVELFKHCWNTRVRRCFVTGQNLSRFENGPLFLSVFAHVLRKSAFPEWRLNSNNIVMLSPSYKDYSIHRLYDFASLEEILKFEEKYKKSFQILFELESELIKQYSLEVRKTVPQRTLVSIYLNQKRD